MLKKSVPVLVLTKRRAGSGDENGMCLETVIEFECIRTIRAGLEFSGCEFGYCPELPVFVNYKLKTCGFWGRDHLNLD